ncbi:unnamed protein product [Cuscuta europaea]|uniref:J domain-containing protein n=1 Tax=Cuscuta europaea TaxID=41803 RepID=A0A9P0ZBA8_CUSEU|nr:unnamed protein product [Cuscuta europaea]CAH9092658.1 unnamed protein product [Cuscuta europaea]
MPGKIPAMPLQPCSRVQPAKASPTFSAVETLKTYWLPLTLFAASLYFQLLVLPHFFPPSHYDVLGIKRFSSTEEVTKAYEKITSQWSSSTDAGSTNDFIKVQYAFELLTNQIWKRDYDIFGIDEQHDVIDKAKVQYNGTSISEIRLPLIEPVSFELADCDYGLVNSDSFVSVHESNKAFLVQMLSFGSGQCQQFLHKWKRIVELLDGVANTGMVELGDAQLATYLAEKRSSGQPFFRYGVPALVAFPPGCKSLKCLHRYDGQLSVDAVTDWIATDILRLARIPYYLKESMAQKFLAKSKPHKVKVIFFSKTGERASPFIRQAAKSYSAFADFAFVFWQERESSLWLNMFGVESAPALVFLKETGVRPIVYHGYINSSMFLDIMEKNKHQVLPQLRSVTSMELGCDARGFSRAGNDTKVWYCVVLAGRQSQELNEMRETMRRVQGTLSNGEWNTVDQDSFSAIAELALKEKRLTFTWLDGEQQKRYCFFYVNSESSYETCGPRYDITDVSKLFIVRYSRNSTDEKNDDTPKNSYEALFAADTDPASQLVATYSGPLKIPEIIQWISEIIKNGDSNDLPSFKTKTPELVPEEADSIWSTGSQTIIAPTKGIKPKIKGFVNKVHDYLGDPRIGPILLLGALLSFGHIWLRKNQPSHVRQTNDSSQPPNGTRKEKPKGKDRLNLRKGQLRNQLIPPSLTDIDPKDAQQMEFSNSDTDFR